MLELRSIFKSFHDGESDLQVLRGIDLSVAAGQSVALLGASGNGKSTLLQIAAGLEDADSGAIQSAAGAQRTGQYAVPAAPEPHARSG